VEGGCLSVILGKTDVDAQEDSGVRRITYVRTDAMQYSLLLEFLAWYQNTCNARKYNTASNTTREQAKIMITRDRSYCLGHGIV
jgi:hypothetical protein